MLADSVEDVGSPPGQPCFEQRIEGDDDAAMRPLRAHAPDELPEIDDRAGVQRSQELLKFVENDQEAVRPSGR